MTGFNVDIGRLGAIGGKVSGAGETLTAAVRAITGTAGGDLGSDELNQAVTQVIQQTGKDLGDLAAQAASVAENLVRSATDYRATEQSNATGLTTAGSGK